MSYYASKVVDLGLGLSLPIKNIMQRSSEGMFKLSSWLTNRLFIEIRTRRLHIAVSGCVHIGGLCICMIMRNEN